MEEVRKTTKETIKLEGPSKDNPDDYKHKEFIAASKSAEENRTRSASELMVKDWRFAFDRKVNGGLQRPSNKDIMFAINMIQEEFKELTDEIFGEDREIKEENIVDFPLDRIADHLGDTSWVTQGMMYLFGLNPTKVAEEIYNSNMSKMCSTLEEAELTVTCYADGTHPNKPGKEIEAHYQVFDDMYFVHRTSDGKILKSINFIEPDFSGM